MFAITLNLDVDELIKKDKKSKKKKKKTTGSKKVQSKGKATKPVTKTP